LIRYFDSSALVKRYVREAGARAVERYLASSTLATSRLTEAEISAALARRVREGDVKASDRRRALDALRADLSRFHVVELVPGLIASVHQLLERHALRAADAIHLAAARSLRDQIDPDLELVSYDQRLNAAARAEGVPVLP